MIAKVTVVVVGAIALLLTGCDGPQTDLSCPEGGEGVVGEASSAVVTTPEGPVLRVQGRSEHRDGLAITGIRVGELDATPDEGAFNFSRWTLEVPTALLGAPGTTATLDVTAIDACEASHTFAQVKTELVPARAVTSLELAIDYPGDETYLPSTLVVPARLEIAAGGDAAGVPVEVSAEGANFLGSNGAAVTLTLAQGAAGGAVASTSTFVTSSEPGELLITATALGRVAKQTLRVAGPPTIFPASGDLFAGNQVNIQVLTDGRLASCDVRAPDGVTVQIGTDIVSGPVPLELNRGQDLTVRVSVGGLAEEGDVSLLCRDSYGQATEALFTVTQ